MKDAVIGVTGIETYAGMILQLWSSHQKGYLEHNAINHHTGKFDLVSEHQVPVWRRGQTALITVTTTQPFNAKTQRMRITFDFG